LGYEGHIWVALYNGGLTRSANSGKNFTKIANVTTCSAVGVGKKGPGAGYPTIYIWGTIGGVTGIYRTTDQGATWVRINDNAHEYGGPGNGQFVIGDMNVYGRVYMSTVGRGIAYGEPMYDCFGDSAGAAFYDNCGVCVGGNTGNVPCLDCNGVSNGTAFKDSCNLCVGGNTGLKACVKDCKGDWGGTANLDSCKTCVGGNTGLVACIKDCNGVWGGTANLDSCQICVGGNTGKVACIWDAVNVGKGKTFSYAPNPFENSFHLQVTDPSGYKIFNITGALVDSGYCEKSCYIGANLNPGIYSLTIRNQYEIKTVKIIKQ
jgi:hypothetical protein